MPVATPITPVNVTVAQTPVTLTSVPPFNLPAVSVDAIIQQLAAMGITFTVPITSANLTNVSVARQLDGTFNVFIKTQ